MRPLQFAVYKSQGSVAEALLELGADGIGMLDVTGDSALSTALIKGDWAMVATILRAEAGRGNEARGSRRVSVGLEVVSMPREQLWKRYTDSARSLRLRLLSGLEDLGVRPHELRLLGTSVQELLLLAADCGMQLPAEPRDDDASACRCGTAPALAAEELVPGLRGLTDLPPRPRPLRV